MTDREHCLELIHAEIDGELTGAQQAELSRTLLADPATRALRDELRQFCRAIDSVPPEEVPADLRVSIMESLPVLPPVCEDRDVRPGGRYGRPVLRYAAAFAGGLIVSALAFQVAVQHQALDSGELAGTIAASDPSRLELRLDEVRGTIELEGTATSPVVQARLVADHPIQVIARLDGQEVRLSGFAAAHNQPTELSGAFSRAAVSAPVIVKIEVVDPTSGRMLRTADLRPNVPN